MPMGKRHPKIETQLGRLLKARETARPRIDNTTYCASLIPGGLYGIIPDARAAEEDLLRIADNRGEDHLYHRRSALSADGEPEILAPEMGRRPRGAVCPPSHGTIKKTRARSSDG